MPGDVRGHPVVNRDPAAVELHANRFQADILRVGPDTQRHNRAVGGQLAALVVLGEYDLRLTCRTRTTPPTIVRVRRRHSALDRPDGLHARAGLDLDALPAEGALQRFRERWLHFGEQVRLHLQDGHVGAIRAGEVAKLAADDPAADHHHGLGQGLGDDGLLVGHHHLAVNLHPGEDQRSCAGRNNHVAGGQLSLAVVRSHDDAVAGGEASGATHEVHLGPPQEELDAFGEAPDDLTTAGDCLRVVGVQVVHDNAEVIRVLQCGEEVGAPQQGLRRDTAHVQADAADIFALDDCGT